MSQAIASPPPVAQAQHQLIAVARSYALRHFPITLPFLLIGLLSGIMAHTLWQKPVVLPVVSVLLAGLSVGYAGWRWWRVRQRSLAGVIRELDRRYPELEDSTWLLAEPASELRFLSSLQQQRAAAVDAIQLIAAAAQLPVVVVRS